MKKFLSLALAALLALSSPVQALANSYEGKSNWVVTYTTSGVMSDNYSQQDFVDQVANLQPGDDITFTVTLTHENDSKADWYLSNQVVKSLEEGDAQGSAYAYELTYAGPSGSRTLYSSDRVGGDDSTAGMADATNALDDYIALEQLSKGQTAKVTLKITLDGETESNDYFNKLAQVKFKFAVEPEPSPKTRTVTKTQNRTVVATGDQQRLFPFYVAMVVSGLLFAALAVQSVRQRKQEREENMR